MAHRPESKAPPDVFYNDKEARKYVFHAHTVQVQTRLAERALELLDLSNSLQAAGPALILDLGCGTGLSGDVLTQAGHVWVGLDISSSMLAVAVERDVDGDLIRQDLGQGLPFRIGCFDGAVSISVLQWLCQAERSEQDPRQRLFMFFMTLYACLRRGARAVFQFYPSHEREIEFIFVQAKRAGFDGGLVVDYPNSSRAKKFYLVLRAGPLERAPRPIQTVSRFGAQTTARMADEHIPPSADDELPHSAAAGSHSGLQKAQRKKPWRSALAARRSIEKKRARRLRQGKPVRPPSKYSGRRRSHRF
jgi:18S rRNA (guanine1575-N7)-methyltransferase